MNDKLPALSANAPVARTLILYNDEFRDAQVTIEVQLRAGDKIYATKRQDFGVQPGRTS